ncbi:hypothetical protein HDV02_003976 [Globomyces sp. JEL0801]|nr:hypothetical protein HDV02_003976 [Globomyces sp. JEL0801]
MTSVTPQGSQHELINRSKQGNTTLTLPTLPLKNGIPSRPKTGAHFWNGPLRVKDQHLVDEHGRTVLLRGVNLSGNSKLPTDPEYAKHNAPKFYDHRNVSFIGRPFGLHEAEEHFKRLNQWGLTFARLLVPWEALEHAGPGVYDEPFIDSLIALLKLAPKYGIKCFIGLLSIWTFETVGLNVANFEASGAVHFHDFNDQGMSGKMIWPTNYIKLASATMFTVFFAGNDFAPGVTYEGVPVQEFLQNHFVNCYKHLASRLKGLNAVVGIEAMNEPHVGYIGMPDLSSWDLYKDLRLSNSPSPLEAFALGSGITQDVEFWVKSFPFPSKKQGYRRLNIEKVSAWLPGKECIWKQLGIWGLSQDGKPALLKRKYFANRPDGTPVDFKQHYYAPFLKKFAEGIHEGDDTLIFLFEPIPNEDPPMLLSEDTKWLDNCVFAPHWYDLDSVFKKAFTGGMTVDVQGLSRGTQNIFQAIYFGIAGARKNYAFQISNIVKGGRKNLGLKPILIGECGIPMDINERKAFESGDYTHHTNFLDAILRAMEKNLVHFTLWNYNPHNDNFYGDHWNGEDFSIFSMTPDELLEAEKRREAEKDLPKSPLSPSPSRNSITTPRLTTPDSSFDLTSSIFAEANAQHHIGGRALDAVIRPYAAKTAGIPYSVFFDLEKLYFELIFTTLKEEKPSNTDPITNTTEIFVPEFHFGNYSDMEIKVSDGSYKLNILSQTVHWVVDRSRDVVSPLADSYPKWIGVSNSQVDPNMISTHNFHTLQIYLKSGSTIQPTPTSECIIL